MERDNNTMAAELIPIKKHRIWGLDVIRFICALLIYMSHAIKMYGCTFGSPRADELICVLRSPVMTMFFILSGFSLFYSNYGRFNLDYASTVKFYSKRAVQILPTYIFIHFVYLFLGNDSFRRWLLLTPFEFTFLQSMYPNIFGVLHNGGTWFISCIMMAYFVFPIAYSLLVCLNTRGIFITTVVTGLLLVYIPFVSNYYAMGSNYTNPVFRIIEFFFGLCCCACSISIIRQIPAGTASDIVSAVIIVILSSVYVLSLLRPVVIGSGKFVFLFSALIEYPVFLIILCCCLLCRSEVLENNALLKYCSGLIYYFFILQLILWNLTDLFFNLAETAGLDFIQKTNSGKLIVSFAICAILSVALQELLDKPVKNYCFKRFPVFSKTSL